MLSNISWPQLLILLVLVVLIFGTGKLKGLGKDVGGAIKGFKKAMNEEEAGAKKSESANLEQKDAEFAETKVDVKAETKDKAES